MSLYKCLKSLGISLNSKVVYRERERERERKREKERVWVASTCKTCSNYF